MAEYISKEAVVRYLKGYSEKECNSSSPYGMIASSVLNKAGRALSEMPSADVQPVKHGYWIKQPEKFQIHEDVINSNYLYSCSCCNASDLHSERANNDGEVKFCWRCGARMDGEPDEPWQSE